MTSQGMADIAEAKERLSNLGNVDNTSDADKPVSTAQQAAIDDAGKTTLADQEGADTLPATTLSPWSALMQTTRNSLKWVKEQTTNKVDKVTLTNRVYATNGNGDQTSYTLSKDVYEETIAWRGNSGTLKVGTPTDNAHAATKQYVDAGLATVGELPWKAPNNHAGILIDLGKDINTGEEILFDILYNETYVGTLVRHAHIHGQFYADTSRTGMVQNGNTHVPVFLFRGTLEGVGNTNLHMWIPSTGAIYYPSIKAQAWYRQSAGFYASFSITMSALAAAPVETLLEIASHTNTYSTAKQIVGRWIDNKPIYRQCFSGDITANADAETTLMVLTGVSDVIAFGGTFKIVQSRIVLGSTFVNSDTYGGTATGGIQLNSGNSNTFFVTKTAVARNAAPYRIWVEYTEV